MAKTLEELKRENAEAEAAESEVPQTEDEAPEVEATEEETEELEEDAETSEGEAEETEVELWMQADEQTSEDDGHGVPVAKHAQMRNKLKGAIREKDSEIDQLKAKIEALEQAPPAQTSEQPVQTKRPTLAEFDYDEEAYSQALDAWYDTKFDAKLQAASHKTEASTQQAQAKKAIDDAVDRHYENAEKLIADAGIAPDRYKQADTAVRGMFESIRPGQGDQITDWVISTLGEGSEKVMYYIGRNPSKLAEVQADLIADPSGMKAMARLGRISAEVTAPTKRKSNAPKPARELSGDASTADTAKALKKKYQAASADMQKRIDIRREARQAGFDVSNW